MLIALSADRSNGHLIRQIICYDLLDGIPPK